MNNGARNAAVYFHALSVRERVEARCFRQSEGGYIT